jgi:hypothetical protein
MSANMLRAFLMAFGPTMASNPRWFKVVDQIIFSLG